jgi:hypothetical protein
MISSTPLKHPLPPQVIRPAAPAGQKPANTPHPVAGVRFGGSTPTPSLWERFKQGVARLWNTIISPFKSILSWFKTPEASPKASETPGSAPSPSQNQDPSAKPTPPAASAEAQTAEARPAAPADPSPSATPPPAALPARPKPETLPRPGSLPVSASQPRKNKKSRKSSSTEPKPESLPVKSQVTQPQGHTPQPAQPTIVDQPMDSQRPRTPQQASQPAQPVRPTTDNQPISPPTPGIWARATSFLAGLRPQPSAQQRHQEALNALQEIIGEPETPPPAPSKQQTHKSSEPGTPSRNRPAATSSRPVSAPASLARGIPVETLFGKDLTRIQFQQKGGNTCYLLAALNGIFHHPQGKRILESIHIEAIPNGYRVQFPGQKDPVDVFDHELGHLTLANKETVKGVVSNAKGVQILECAYSKLDNHIEIHEDGRDLTEGFGEFFGVEHCLKALFGQQNVSLPVSDREDALLCNALNTQRQKTDFADIWVGQKIHYIDNERIPTLARHYLSVVPRQNPPSNVLNYLEVKDPYIPDAKHVCRLENLNQRYQVSSVRIRLPRANASA